MALTTSPLGYTRCRGRGTAERCFRVGHLANGLDLGPGHWFSGLGPARRFSHGDHRLPRRPAGPEGRPVPRPAADRSARVLARWWQRDPADGERQAACPRTTEPDTGEHLHLHGIGLLKDWIDVQGRHYGSAGPGAVTERRHDDQVPDEKGRGQHVRGDPAEAPRALPEDHRSANAAPHIGRVTSTCWRGSGARSAWPRLGTRRETNQGSFRAV